MSLIYSSPLRVYICLGLLALFGIFSGVGLPISMFPNSSKPTVVVNVPYSSLTPDEFAKVYGGLIENRMRSLADEAIKIEKLQTDYQSDKAQFKIVFDWGVEQKRAVKEVETSIFGLSGQFPREMRDHIQVWSWSENSGFLAVSFYSEKRGLDELYELLEPSLTPKLAQIQNADEAALWNPTQKEVSIELNPENMAALGVLPRDVARAVELATNAQNGGSLLVNTNNLRVQMPRPAIGLEDLKSIPVMASGGRAVHLRDVGHVELKTSAQNSRSFKTSGSPSLILFATPSPGGNIKVMAESILKIVEELRPSWPKDVQSRVLVDPSEFIRNSIENVFHEVILAACLAVVILFLFVGSLRNVATAAIEIPLSIVLAFILMRMNGININLISLGGLALSAGMNVDASVVVMENIFRHFEMHKGPMDAQSRLAVVVRAVSEVRLPVIASTIASLVVFLPLAFTSDLSYAILGDLAKTVVFSHGFSAVVALILVPTIRLQLMDRDGGKSPHSPLEKQLHWLEKFYISTLGLFLRRRKVQLFTYAGLIATLAILVGVVLPRLPREIIGTPDTDWMVIALNTQGNTLIRQMEEQAAEVESNLLKKFGKDINYTFTQIRGANRATVMARLSDKGRMQSAWKEFQEYFQNTPFMKFFVIPWNPSELPIPDPPHFQASILGGTSRERLNLAHELDEALQSQKIFSRVWQEPNHEKSEEIVIRPHMDQWSPLISAGANVIPGDLADISRIATQGRSIGQWVLNNRVFDLVLHYPEGTIKTIEDLASFPLGVNNKIIPLKALAEVQIQAGEPPRHRENQQDVVLLQAKQDKGQESGVDGKVLQAQKIIKNWLAENRDRIGNMTVQFDDAQHELNGALKQLGWAIGLSILLIFVTMVIQLGDVVSSLLVLISVPLGIIGVILSLAIFGSTLSLNSALGVILLNGISVANSIILVDFFNKLMAQGRSIEEAALEAAHARLRPILMTSLTTAIGMLPVALGLGEGGRVLQPLGIAVTGGLWISMLFTLFIVPALQVNYWQWRRTRAKARMERGPLSELSL
ncbi:MAG: efflux RND transporter permease subunit [Bdellovibrionales bacterium]